MSGWVGDLRVKTKTHQDLSGKIRMSGKIEINSTYSDLSRLLNFAQKFLMSWYDLEGQIFGKKGWGESRKSVRVEVIATFPDSLTLPKLSQVILVNSRESWLLRTFEVPSFDKNWGSGSFENPNLDFRLDWVVVSQKERKPSFCCAGTCKLKSITLSSGHIKIEVLRVDSVRMRARDEDSGQSSKDK